MQEFEREKYKFYFFHFFYLTTTHSHGCSKFLLHRVSETEPAGSGLFLSSPEQELAKGGSRSQNKRWVGARIGKRSEPEQKLSQSYLVPKLNWSRPI